MKGSAAGSWDCIGKGKVAGITGVSRLAQGPEAVAAEPAEKAKKSTLTFLAVLAKWVPQALQLGSEPVVEGKELYPGLE